MHRALVAAICLFASACSVTIAAGRPATLPANAFVISDAASLRCVHGIPGPNSPYRQPLAGPTTDPELLPYLANIPPAARRTAVAAGIEPLLARLLRARALNEDPAQILRMRQELSDRIATLETQLTAMEFECDCVRGLLRETLDEYTESETDRQLDLTIASLIVGASTGIAAGVWDLANGRSANPAFEEGPLFTSILGAATTSALGAAVLMPEEREILYVHEHNILTPILRGDDPEYYFPTFIFRLLTLPQANGAATPRDDLVSEWNTLIDEHVSSDDHAVAEQILFGAGGVHDPSLLALHEDLLQSLGASLDALARDIDLLTRTVEVALDAPQH